MGSSKGYRFLPILLVTLCICVINITYAQKSDTLKKPETQKSDSLTVAKKKHKLWTFLNRRIHNSEEKLKGNTSPHYHQPSTATADDTSQGKHENKFPSAYQPNLNNTSLKIAKSDTLQKTSASKQDSNKSPPKRSFVSRLGRISTHGSISLGYDYGVLPFASEFKVPLGYYHSEGQGQFNLGILPFNGSYCYSDIKNISGLNNYFRVSFDAQKFKQEYQEKESQEEGRLKGSLGQLYKARQLAEQKLLYLKSIENRRLPAAGTDKIAIPADNPESNINKDESVIGGDLKGTSSLTDTTGLDENYRPDTSGITKSARKSISRSVSSGDADSISKDEERYEKQIDGYGKEIEKITKKINGFKKDEEALEHNNPYMSKIYNMMSGIKKLDIGLCYPDYSTYLISGMAVKGINMEYQKKDLYLAATEGTTVNTLFFTNNSLQNHLANMQNLYNMFDFRSIQNGRKVVAVKTGWGGKENTHLYIGMLYGNGLPSYLNNYNSDPVSGLSKNYVMEVDGRWKISNGSYITLVYGKSSTQTKGDNFNITDGGIFNAYHTRAIMGKYGLLVKKTHTNLTFTGRWIDPYFNSFGVGYMRADNFRYEAKAEQPFGKKIKVSAFYRKDEDDVLQLYQFHTVLQTIGTNATIRLIRSLTLRVGYTPVIEHMWGTTPVYSVFNKNNICNAILTYAPIIRRVYTVCNISYNYYKLTSDTQTVVFRNFSFNNITRFRGAITNSLSANWFKSQALDSLNNNTWMFSDELGYSFHKGVIISIGGKAALNMNTTNWQYGGLAKIKVPLVKHLSCELEAEKLVLGDFYNSFDIQQIEKFPYYCQGRLIIGW